MKRIIFLILLSGLGLGAYAQTLKDAQTAIEAEQYEKARTILDKLVRENPDNGLYEFHSGNLFLTQGEFELAKAAFERGAAAKNNAQINHIGLGQLLLDDNKIAEAQEQFDKATYKIKKKDAEKYLYIAKAYYGSFRPDYTQAVEYARKAVEADPNFAQSYLILGDAEYKLDNLNEAYTAYRAAFDRDPSLLRAKLNLAIITKDALAFPQAVSALEEINALDPSYGPAYRELAEVYYQWASKDKDVHDEYLDKALRYYEKYMDLTDYSLDSRMRHADFLALVKDYKALEKEAAEMQKIDQVNPRILRYLGYSAYENANYTEAVDALTRFLEIVDQRRVLGIDYAYLARAQVKLLETNENEPVNVEKLNRMLASLTKAIEMGSPIEDEFNQLGTKLYRARDYENAAAIFATLIASGDVKSIDRLYYANSIFYHVANMDEETQARYLPQMEKADSVYALVIESSPTTQDTYYNRARLNRYIPGAEDKTADLFSQYIDVTLAKGEEETSKPVTQKKLSEAYTSLGSHYSDIDPKRAIGYFERAIEFDPENEHAAQALAFLKK